MLYITGLKVGDMFMTANEEIREITCCKPYTLGIQTHLILGLLQNVTLPANHGYKPLNSIPKLQVLVNIHYSNHK